MGMMYLRMDLSWMEMRVLSLMCRQITAAKVVDGDQMETESQASLSKAVLDDDLMDPSV